MAPHAAVDQEQLLKDAYTDILRNPFETKYEDTWEEDTYWLAVEQFKRKSKELGIDDPFEILSKYRITSYTDIRDKLKAGPPLCLREGWSSPLLGKKIDVASIIAPLRHLNGRVYIGDERVVVLDFWATWCPPCVKAGPELSELYEKYPQVALVGINNDAMFYEKPYDPEAIQTFLEENKEGFRYTIYMDTQEGHARNAVYIESEYRAIPCVIVIVDGVVTFVGPPKNEFKAALEAALQVADIAEP
ncbi:hypothetical protein BGZ94_010237 [Podila epigama]|nr:hypothetical protein BGZ94_010237 [Podila epigama]